jgi:hypothetical protein
LITSALEAAELVPCVSVAEKAVDALDGQYGGTSLEDEM